MLTDLRLKKVLQAAKTIPLYNNSRIIIMSDCHRGNGSRNDNFLKNKDLFLRALTYYYYHNYTYIELGDGDELWENKSYKQIIATHSDVFSLLANFHKKSRLYMVFGNHDMVKKDLGCIPHFPEFEFYQALLLKNEKTLQTIFLTHGHQGDIINDYLWKLARFLVRYIWRPLELIGFSDPTSPAKNYEIKEKVELRLKNWASKEQQMIIAGHTHRPIFPPKNEPPYFNDGSCVHPSCITGIEIIGGEIILIKWCLQSRVNKPPFISREILTGPEKLTDYIY